MPDRTKEPRWSRREAIGGALGTAALAVAAPGLAQLPTPTPGSTPARPNYLFIMADDLGYADLSCYGRREYRTPVLDALAAQGMRFTHGYANSAVCSAMRVGVITGRYQYRTRIGLEEPLGGAGGSALGLDPAHPTLPSLLRDQGYHTALIGKWHLGLLPGFGPLQSGYDEFWGNRGGGIDYFSHDSGGRDDLWDGDVPIEGVGYYTDMLAERSLEFLAVRAREARPWLLSLHFTAPHWPLEANDAPGRAESARLAALLVEQAPTALFHHDGGTAATYAAMVTALDAAIGRVLARLGALGMARDTVVVFTSDNGGERFSDTWPFSGRKTELLEGGIRVPLIVRWPGLAEPGSTSEAPVRRWTSCPPSWRQPAARPIWNTPATGSTSAPHSPAARCPSACCSGATGTRTRRRCARGATNTCRSGQRVPVRHPRRSARARRPQAAAARPARGDEGGVRGVECRHADRSRREQLRLCARQAGRSLRQPGLRPRPAPRSPPKPVRYWVTLAASGRRERLATGRRWTNRLGQSGGIGSTGAVSGALCWLPTRTGGVNQD